MAMRQTLVSHLHTVWVAESSNPRWDASARTAVAAAIAGAIFWLLGQPPEVAALLIGAIVATIIVDIPHIPPRVTIRLGMWGALIFVLGAITGWLGALSLPLAIGMIAVWGFISSFAGVFGKLAAFLAYWAPMSFAINLAAFTITPDLALGPWLLWLMAGFVLGTAVCAVPLLRQRDQLRRRLVAKCFRPTAHVHDIANVRLFFSPDPALAPWRRWLPLALRVLKGRKMAQRSIERLSASDQTAFQQAFNEANTVSNAIADAIEQPGKPVSLATLDGYLASLTAPPDVTPAWRAAFRSLHRLHDALADTVAALADPAQLPELQPEGSPVSSIGDTIRANLTLDSMWFRHSIRMAVALACALAAALIIQDILAIWSALMVYLILRPDIDNTVDQSLLRAAGTFIGVVIGIVLASLITNHLAHIILAVLIFAVARSFMGVSVGKLVIFITIMIVLLHDTSDPWLVGGERLLATLIGIGLALIFGYVILPTWNRINVPEQLAELITATRDLLHLVLETATSEDPADRQARIDAFYTVFRKSRNLRTSFGKIANTYQGFEADVEWYNTAVGSTMQVFDDTVMVLQERDSFAQVPADVRAQGERDVQTLTDLAQAVRHNTPPPTTDATDIHPDDTGVVPDMVDGEKMPLAQHHLLELGQDLIDLTTTIQLGVEQGTLAQYRSV